MQAKPLVQGAVLMLLLFSLPALLGSDGCGSSSGSSSTTGPTTAAGGSAVANPLLANATVTAEDANGTAVNIGSVLTNNEGNFTVNIPVGTAYPVILSFTGGTLVENGTAFTGTVKSFIKDNATSTAYGSTLTTIAVEIFRSLAQSGMNATARFEQANETVTSLVTDFGAFDIFDTPPVTTDGGDVSKAQRYRYANNWLVALIAQNIGQSVGGAVVDKSKPQFYEYVRAVALDLADKNWDGQTDGTANSTVQALLGDMRSGIGNSSTAFMARIGTMDPGVSWNDVLALMQKEVPAGGNATFVTTRPSNIQTKVNTVKATSLPGRVSVVGDAS